MGHLFRDLSYRPGKRAPYVKDLVFVVMPFQGRDMEDVFTAIKDECVKLGLNATRVDENVGSGFIIKDIVDLIQQAEFVIVDLSRERPNVYYELGYIHGVGFVAEEILLIAQGDAEIHFDIAPLRIMRYRSTKQLRSIVASSMKTMMESTRKEKVP
jgi:hypothetical protein